MLVGTWGLWFACAGWPGGQAGAAEPAVEVDLAWADEHLNGGRYKEAVEILRKTRAASENGSARWREASFRLAKVLRTAGEYAEALKLCEETLQALPEDKKDKALGCLRAELLTETGQYAEALKLFDAAIEADPQDHRAWAMRRNVASELGRKDLLRKTSDHFFELYQKDPEYYNSDKLTDPMELAYVGVGLQDENPKDAFEVGFDLANRLIAKRGLRETESLVWSGQLALEKYAFGEAHELFEKALKLRPKLPDALTGKAQVLLAVRHDLKGAEPLLKQALEINSRHIPSHLLKATLDFTDDRFDEARKHIDVALAVNPHHVETLAMLAFYHHYLKQPDQEAEVAKRVLDLNPKCAEFYCRMAELIEDKHVFDEAPAYYKKAIELDPDHWHGYYGLGMNTSRQGAHGEVEGKRLLLKAFKTNPFNLWASNMIKVLDKFNGDAAQEVPPVYQESHAPNFTLKFHKKEAEVVKAYLEEWAEAALEGQAQQFGFKPQGPLTVELCFTTGDQDARTVGIPVGGLLGVCFGKLCTVLSPRNGNGAPLPPFNWRKVLDHEFAHVMALQLSEYRVPLWFTEALSTFVEADSRLNTDQLIVNLYYKGQLKPIERMQEYIYENRILAYVHGRFVIEYLVHQLGFEAIRKALKLFAAGKNLEQAVGEVTGKSMAEVNKGVEGEVREFLTKVRLRPQPDPAVMTKLELAASASDASAQALAELAIAYLTTGKVPRAEACASKALEKDPKCVDALNVLGTLAYQKKDFARAQKLYLESTRHDPERSFTAWHRLGVMYKKEGRTRKAIEALETARKLYPRYVGPDNPYYLLPELYADLEPPQNEQALAVWRDAIAANTDDAEAAEKGLKLALEIKDWNSAARFAMAHIEIDPYKVEIHRLAGPVFEALKDLPRAAREYRVAAVLDEKDVESLYQLARLEHAQGHREEAVKAVQAALEIDGTHEKAKALRKELGL